LQTNNNTRPSSHLDPIRKFLSLFFKHSRIFYIIFCGIVAAVVLVAITRTPLYEANAKLIVEKKQDSQKALLLGINEWVSHEQYNWINSEVEVLKSYPVAIAVLEDVGREYFLSKESDKPIDEQFKSAAFQFQSNLEIVNNKNSNIIDIIYHSPEPKLAQAIVESVIKNYSGYRSSMEKESEEFDFLQGQLEMVNTQINDLEKVQTQFKKQMGMLDPEVQRDILLTRIADYESQLTEVRSRKFSKEARIEIVQEQFENNESTNIPQTEASDSPSREKHIAHLKGNLLQLEIKHTQMLQKYNKDYVEVKNIVEQIAETRRQIKNEVEQIINAEMTAIKALNAEEKVIQDAIARTNNEVQDFSEKEFAYSKINRGIDDNKEIYSMLLKQREEARISLTQLNDGLQIKTVSPAIVSSAPSKPNKKLIVIAGAMLGLILAFALTLVSIYFDDTLETQEEVQKFTGIPVLGTVRNV
jgi:polysaccharide biosynthesis transport protein